MLVCSVCLCCTPRSILQVSALDEQGFLDPEDPKYPYFALRGNLEDTVYRAAYWQEKGECVKDLQILTIACAAVGVTTLFPYV